MRIIFMNLHCNVFYVKTLDYFLRNKNYKNYKYSYIIKYLLNNNIKIGIYINDNGSTLPNWIKKYINNKYLRKIECYLVLLLNGYDPRKFIIINNKDKIKNTDVVIGHIFYNDDLYNFQELNGKKMINLSHFTYRQPINEKYFSNLKTFIYEADVSEDPFFKRYYGWYNNKFYILPFTYQSRFIVSNSFYKRKNKVMAVGTLAYCEQKEYVDLYKTTYLHPMGKLILENMSTLTEYMDSYVSFVREKKLKEVLDTDYILVNIYKSIYNYYNFDKQKQYYSFDMVQKFNEYKMFICPEEITGEPRIGFIEGMACGCAYIGLNHKMYSDIGLVEGVHYIGYDGSLEDLISKITYYQNNEDELKKIAITGCEFVRLHFNQNKVAKKFYNDLRKLT